MNKTEILISLLPEKITRKNKCYNLFITRKNEGSEKRIQVGYARRDSRGKTEVFTLTDKPLRGEGFNKAMMETFENLVSDGFAAMGYNVERAQA